MVFDVGIEAAKRRPFYICASAPIARLAAPNPSGKLAPIGTTTQPPNAQG
jgi:hypothetical protein